VLPNLFRLQGAVALVIAAVLVGIALIDTGVIVGLLSGGPPLRRALRQLLIGYGAAAVTYLLGLLLGHGTRLGGHAVLSAAPFSPLAPQQQTA
jgi:VIT1/CCC1 family predicted Fe2+/Mn2+ transporter